MLMQEMMRKITTVRRRLLHKYWLSVVLRREDYGVTWVLSGKHRQVRHSFDLIIRGSKTSSKLQYREERVMCPRRVMLCRSTFCGGDLSVVAFEVGMTGQCGGTKGMPGAIHGTG